jgi:D-alanyl-D-alanine dipeptidase
MILFPRIDTLILVFIALFFMSCVNKEEPKTNIELESNTQSDFKASFVNMEELIPDAILDVRYATPNNFTKQVVYDSATVYLVDDAAYALQKVADDLREEGIVLVLFDGYRPIAVQEKFWEIYPDPKFVANPKSGSRHNRGAAIDLSLAYADGTYLTMPTDYDYFGEKAAQDYMDLTEEQISNRAILREVMTKHGFSALASEWWHFDYKGWEKYPIIR